MHLPGRMWHHPEQKRITFEYDVATDSTYSTFIHAKSVTIETSGLVPRVFIYWAIISVSGENKCAKILNLRAKAVCVGVGVEKNYHVSKACIYTKHRTQCPINQIAIQGKGYFCLVCTDGNSPCQSFSIMQFIGSPISYYSPLVASLE